MVAGRCGWINGTVYRVFIGEADGDEVLGWYQRVCKAKLG